MWTTGGTNFEIPNYWFRFCKLPAGQTNPFRCTGFGIVVTSAQGELLAYGLGWPPSWCDTAAAAEAWALQFVVCSCPFLPDIRTDCQALISTAASGTKEATHHGRPLARIWGNYHSACYRRRPLRHCQHWQAGMDSGAQVAHRHWHRGQRKWLHAHRH